jgi:aryl-alcohol dehydrogenase-like predicted oxidoreductase
MRVRSLGPDAAAVSAIGFGAMPLSTAGRPPEPQAIRTIHAALDAGVTLIDTANVYCLDDRDIGHNERLVAKALRSWPGAGNGAIVATKGGMTRPEGRWERNGGHPDRLGRACDASLKALGVERIDLYQYHAPDPNVPFAESVGALAELKAQGKIRWVGLSNVSVAQIEEARKTVPITTVQNRLSPFFREALERGVVAYCGAQGIGFLAYSPVGGGRLNKKLPDHPAVRAIAERLGASPHAVVLAWVLAQGPAVIPIPGGRTPEHVRDATGAADITLTDNQIAAITRATFSTA